MGRGDVGVRELHPWEGGGTPPATLPHSRRERGEGEGGGTPPATLPHSRRERGEGEGGVHSQG